MKVVAPQFSRKKVDHAGEILASAAASPEERENALAIWDNWRTAHNYPLNAFTMTLKRKAHNVDENSLVAQRLKRLPSVEKKLRRWPSMKLSRMQDIGGCRAVVGHVDDVYELRRRYEDRRMIQELRQEHDYIASPKEDGYRSLHLVYKYVGRDSDAWDGLQIELQLRSRLQHAWATAVETVDTLHHQALKIGGGSKEWRRFFAVMGSVIALREGTRAVPGTPVAEKDLMEELVDLSEKLNPEEKLLGYRDLVNQATTQRVSGAKYFILELRPGQTGQQTLEISGYKSQEIEQATQKYLEIERNLSGGGEEAVLVSVDSVAALPKAYPNYFLDTELFIKAWRQAMGKRA